MKKHIFLYFIFLTNTVILFGQSKPGATTNDLQLNTITTALPFMSITPDSRAGGMGEAGTALSATSNSIYWNTSMLNFAKESSEIGISYTPWLRQLTSDMSISYLSGYKRFNEKHVIGGSLRYFALGEITFTDATGAVTRHDKPSEWEITTGYGFKLSPKFSVGINGKFAYSNLTGGLPVAGVSTKAAIAGATDISFTYFNEDAKIGSTRGTYTFATTINNIGNKVNYSQGSTQLDFIPMNLKIANSFKAEIDNYNSFTFALEAQKLLVPSPPTYATFTNGGTSTIEMIAGKDNNIGIVSGIMQSFYDAPGVVAKDANGNYIKNSDGTYQIVKNSRLKEELSEINICTGIEYWYNNIFAVRSGFFYESKNKGNRRYANIGIGLKYNKFSIDMSYLLAVNGKSSPLANTLRFSLRMSLGKDKKVLDKPE
ncbi:MAG: type IX secretion system outer membrane channel protein PorV [Flavobacteriia bacterium]|nr:type IX secretion system outer membrane channel protein PorV [Flavobacteriia bacterium]